MLRLLHPTLGVESRTLQPAKRLGAIETSDEGSSRNVPSSLSVPACRSDSDSK